jgi:hypothetical protein
MTKTTADDEARLLFEGLVPELTTDLAEMWEKYSPTFSVLAENGDDGPLVMQAGAYRYVEFNHRMLRAFWLGSYVAWEAYAAAQKSFDERGFNHTAFDGTRLTELLSAFDAMIAAEDSATVPLPAGIPEPGTYPSADDGEALSPAELATFAIGWGFLHEICHLLLQQRGESTAADDPVELQHGEELTCDAFAARTLLDHVGDYAAANGVDADRVARKRQLGIIFALFVLALIDPNRHAATPTHPALQSRIDHLALVMKLDQAQIPFVVGTLAFLGLSSVRPHQLRLRLPAS